jgi:hypothetical protein
MNTTLLARLPLLIGLIAALSITIAACSSGAAASVVPSASQTASPPTSEEPVATDPDTSVGAPSDPGAGGGQGGPAIVVPKPGTIDPRPVSVETIEPSIDGRHVTVKLTWTSGVEPCYVLDSVVMSRDGNAIVLTVFEGAGEEGAICIEIAQQKATIVDLGELEPGDYTVEVTDSDIPPVSITVV